MPSGDTVSKKQLALIQRMLEKDYRIISLRFFPHSGHVTVGARVKKGTKYFFISQSGRLMPDADDK